MNEHIKAALEEMGIFITKNPYTGEAIFPTEVSALTRLRNPDAEAIGYAELRKEHSLVARAYLSTLSDVSAVLAAMECLEKALETIKGGDCVPWVVADEALKQHNGS